MAKIAASKTIREKYPSLPAIELRFRERWDCSIVHINDFNPEIIRFKPLNRFIVVGSMDEAKMWIEAFGYNDSHDSHTEKPSEPIAGHSDSSNVTPLFRGRRSSS